jgi:hypothetical protein
VGTSEQEREWVREGGVGGCGGRENEGTSERANEGMRE